MAKRILNVTMPASVSGGEDFDVTVAYTADQDGDLEIAYLGSFDGRPDREPLEAGAQSKTFKMAIVRQGSSHRCEVEFRFGNDRLCLLEVM